MLISLLRDKKEEKSCLKKEESVTILIPVYNSKKYIRETLESIKKQKYCGDIYINIIDDASTDGSLELLESMDADSKIMLIKSNHIGKASALNKVLEHVKTDYTITIYSDTILHPFAIRNIMNKLVNSDEKTAATAGCIIAFTELPETLGSLGKQRRRWARGMIEAFKKVKILTSKKLNFKAKFLMCLNIFFLFIDLALLIFVPLGLILLALGSQLLIGWMSLFVLLLGMILCLLIEIRRKNILKDINCKLKRRSFLAFIVYVLLYAFILAPYCLIGYISELINCKKEW